MHHPCRQTALLELALSDDCQRKRGRMHCDFSFYAVAVVRSLVLPAHAGGTVLPVPVVLWIMRVLHAGIVIPMLRSVMLPALIFIALVGHAAVHGCRKESRVGFASARVPSQGECVGFASAKKLSRGDAAQALNITGLLVVESHKASQGRCHGLLLAEHRWSRVRTNYLAT